jgi:hypothetical protein
MKYVIVTFDYGKPMYFTEHEGPGFTISNKKDKAKGYKTKKEAIEEADRLTIVSGSQAVVERK